MRHVPEVRTPRGSVSLVLRVAGGREKAQATLGLALDFRAMCPYIVGVEVSGNPVVRGRVANNAVPRECDFSNCC